MEVKLLSTTRSGRFGMAQRKLDGDGTAQRMAVDEQIRRTDSPLPHQIVPGELGVLVHPGLGGEMSAACAIAAIVDHEHRIAQLAQRRDAGPCWCLHCRRCHAGIAPPWRGDQRPGSTNHARSTAIRQDGNAYVVHWERILGRRSVQGRVGLEHEIALYKVAPEAHSAIGQRKCDAESTGQWREPLPTAASACRAQP